MYVFTINTLLSGWSRPTRHAPRTDTATACGNFTSHEQFQRETGEQKNSAALPLSPFAQQQQQQQPLASTVFVFALYGHKSGGVTEREGGGVVYCFFWRRREGAGLRAVLEPLEPGVISAVTSFLWSEG